MLPAEVLDSCRLCLVKEDVSLHIFESESNSLSHKISTCLPISIAREDGLPKKICVTCSDKVNMLYEFWNQTLNAEKHLLCWLEESTKTLHSPLQEKKTENNECEVREIKEIADADRQYEENYDDEEISIDCDDFVDTQEKNEPFHNLNSDDNSESNLSISNNDGQENENLISTKQLQNMKDSVLLWFNQKSQCYEVAEDDGNDEATAKDCEQVPPKLDIVKIKSTLSKCLQRAVSYENRKRSMNRRRMKAIDYKEDMITWEETHSKEKLFKCRHCDQEFKSTVLRTKHEKATHTKHDVKYNCDKCSYSTYTKGCFTMHLKRHIKQYNLFCEECSMGFFNNTELTSHNIKFHEMQPFQCALCNDIFTSKGNLYSHIKSHDPNNSYVCEICGRTYKKKNSFKRHIARAHLGLTAKAQCAVCQRVLSSKEHLRRHMLTHTDERNWVCSTCGKCFLSKTYLTEHCRIHLGIRPYKCEICEKSFTQRGSLTIHKRSHTGERPYRCEFCNKGFVMSTLLRYHLKKCNEAKMSTHAKGYSVEENISDDKC